MNVQKIGVLGAGTMGAGIAISAVMGGFDVTLSDSSTAALDRAKAKLSKFLNRQVEKGRLTEADSTSIAKRLSVSEEISGLAGSELVIEAVFEDLEVKRQVFTQLEAIVSRETVLATNTSALKVGDIAEALEFKGRFCGLHYFSPAEVNSVVEVIQGADTDNATIEAVLPALAAGRKVAIPCKDQSGFARNRFFCPYTNEAVRCLEEGLGNHAQIDQVAKTALGVAIGPFAVMNIVKPSINLTAVQNLAHISPFYAASRELKRCGEAGEMWGIDSETPTLPADQAEVIGDRLRGAIFFAVLDQLSESVAAPKDIDIGAERAFTFAVGPVQMMQDLGLAETDRLVRVVNPSGADSVQDTLRKLLAEVEGSF